MEGSVKYHCLLLYSAPGYSQGHVYSLSMGLLRQDSGVWHWWNNHQVRQRAG